VTHSLVIQKPGTRAQQLLALGADVTADVIAFVGHEITDEVEQLMFERLKGYVPRRLRESAIEQDPGKGDG